MKEERRIHIRREADMSSIPILATQTQEAIIQRLPLFYFQYHVLRLRLESSDYLLFARTLLRLRSKTKIVLFRRKVVKKKFFYGDRR